MSPGKWPKGVGKSEMEGLKLSDSVFSQCIAMGRQELFAKIDEN